MHLRSHVFQRILSLPPARTRALAVHKGLRVPMADGIELLADRWVPRQAPPGPLPLALIRTPYGRHGLGELLARPLAERGYQVLVQSTRGTFGSGGAFDALLCEREDGLATLDWVVGQPWCGDSVVLFGLSYLGFVQWAVAGELPPQVKALIPMVTESALTLEFLRADGFSLETPFGWGVLTARQEERGALFRQVLGFNNRATSRALRTLPLADADVAAIGRRSQYIQDILAHDADDPHWTPLDHRHRVAEVAVPVSSTAGWYDIFLPGQLRDFRVLQAEGRPARLRVGPWTHVDRSVIAEGLHDALTFGLPHARGEEPPARAPVRLYVMGQEKWRDFDSWPPAGYDEERLYLTEHQGLSGSAPGESDPDRYRYDPADPTPAIGGVRLSGKAGRVDNAKLEARPDVLTYTTPVLEEHVEVIGDVLAEIWFRSSVPFADVFVRLCDVDERGRSYNVCDGLTSLTGAEAITRAIVRLWPTAHRFKRGHRIRVQVSSGSFPRYARNPGTGEPRATATTLRIADQEVYHDGAHPSAVILPIRRPGG